MLHYNLGIDSVDSAADWTAWSQLPFDPCCTQDDGLKGPLKRHSWRSVDEGETAICLHGGFILLAARS